MISKAFSAAILRLAKCQAVIKPKVLKDILLENADKDDETESVIEMYNRGAINPF